MITTGIVLLCLANLAWDFIDFTRGAQEFRRQEISNTAIKVAEQIQKLSTEPQPANIREYLQDLQDREKIAFFILKSDREPASSSLPAQVSPEFNAIVDGKVRLILDGKTEAPQAAYAGEHIGNQDVVIGRMIPQNFIANVMAYNRGNFWRNFSMQALILIFVIFYSFRELRGLVRSLQWGGIGSLARTRGGAPANFTFREAQSIATAIGKLSDQEQKGRTELEVLRGQILPSLRNELQAGQTPPYEFNAVLVRVDINNSTAVYSNPQLREIQQFWFDYFKVNCAEIATRYGGFVHEEQGDEVIFYFKMDEKNPIAQKSATACMRDIFYLSGDIDQKTSEKFQFHFRVKGALDIGRLRVFKSSFASAKAPGCLKIEGVTGESRNPFVTTVRMMKFIEDKSVNSCVMANSIFAGAQSLVETTLPIFQRVKGIDDQESYHWITGFTTPTPDNVGFFLSDGNLIQSLSQLEQTHWDIERKVAMLSGFRQLNLGRISDDLQKSFMTTLKNSYQRNQTGEDSRILSMLLPLAPKFIKSSESFNEELNYILRQCLVHPEDRVQANAIQAWGDLDLQVKGLQKNMNAFKHNRSLGNSLIVNLKNNLDKPSLKALTKMLSHKDEFMRAAGCYALAEIITHYQRQDASVLETNPFLIAHIVQVKNLVKDTNPMVQRQAQRAISKV